MHTIRHRLSNIGGLLVLIASLVSGRVISRNGLSVEVSNRYVEEYGDPGHQYVWLKDKFLVEPYQTTSLKAIDESASTSNTYTYNWQITDPKTGESLASLTGEKISYEFQQTGKFLLSLSVLGVETGSLASVIDFVVVSKYVRREVRKLLPVDRKAFFHAMEVMYRSTTKKGSTWYGSKFRDVLYYAGIHNDFAAEYSCDHLHDGNGFLPTHVAMDYMVERTLRSVNPAVTLPYWDYGIDADIYYESDFKSFQSSIIFDVDWFGPLNGTGGSWKDAINAQDGRFAFVPIETVSEDRAARGDERVHGTWELKARNQFGLARGPWNANPAPYLTRYQDQAGLSLPAAYVPICESLHEQMNYNDFDTFIKQLQYTPHGVYHTITGGTYAPKFKELMIRDGGWSVADVWETAQFLQGAMKTMWRDGYLKMNESCSDNGAAIDAGAYCPRYCPDYAEWVKEENWNSTYDDVVSLFTQTLDRTPYKGWLAWLKFVCGEYEGGENVAYIGDMWSSSAALDPLFMPMHTAVERTYQWRAMNGFKTFDWPDGSSNNGANCTGHDAGDVQFWFDLFEDDEDGRKYTNIELVELLHVKDETTKLNSIFDNFHWDYCTDQGYPRVLIENATVTKYW